MTVCCFYLTYGASVRPTGTPVRAGAFIGARHTHDRLAHLRAVYEGISFQLRLIRDTFRDQKIDPARWLFLGGGSQSRELTQLIADVFRTRG